MTIAINETINTREAILFLYGTLRDIAGQFAEVLTYCKKKKLFSQYHNIKSIPKENFTYLDEFEKLPV